MKGKYGSTLLAMALMMAETCNNHGNYFDPDESEPVNKPIPAGCKEYTFYGHTVIASNEKNAIRKCKKLSGL